MAEPIINVPHVKEATRDALIDRLQGYERPVEVGIGRRTGVAAALADGGADVTATDVVEREAPDGVRFILDDATAPDPSVYAGADVVYALDLPPELHRPVLEIARRHGADFAFTTLGTDPPAVSARPETIPGETLFWARETSPEEGTGGERP